MIFHIFLGIILMICLLPSIIKRFSSQQTNHIALLNDHDQWSTWYQEERSLIESFFPVSHLVQIEHFGSTSVPGLCAKPVIDILVGVNEFKLLQSELCALQKHGYVFIEKSSFCDRFYLQKRGSRNFNISIVLFEGNVWQECISVRDYLRIHPDWRNMYANVKKNAILYGHTSIKQYSKYKSNFVQNLTKAAITWKTQKNKPNCDNYIANLSDQSF
jgi:GrpB-like predicted nucleotidyltransferase (UPF0157 family)